MTATMQPANCEHGMLAPGSVMIAHGETNRPRGCVRVIEYYDMIQNRGKILVADWVSAEGYEKGWYRSVGLRDKMKVPYDEQVALVRSEVLAYAIKQQEAA